MSTVTSGLNRYLASRSGLLAPALVLVLGGTATATPQKPPASPHASSKTHVAPDSPVRRTIPELEAAVTRSPSDVRPLIELGLAYWARDDSARALETFQRAVRVAPQSADAHNWLGVALSEKADFPGAIAEFRKAIALNPKFGRAYTNLGSALSQSGESAEAVDVFRKALTLEPNSLAAHTNLALALRDRGELDEALQHLHTVVKAEPQNASVQYELAQTLRQNGDLPGAIAGFEQAIALDPELREGYYGLGQALKQQAARAATNAAPPAAPTEAFVRARDAAMRGELDAARDQLKTLLQSDASNPEAENLLGFILGQQGNTSDAVTHLQRAVTLRPEAADYHYNLGMALWFSGSKDAALQQLRESVRLDPSAGASYAALGVALRDTGDLAQARANLQRAVALLPPTAAVYVDLGITFLRARELDRAVAQLEAGLNVNGVSGPSPDWEGAIRELRPAITANPQLAEAHNVLGLLLGRAGAKTSDVAAEFREAIRLKPDYAEAENNLGLVLLQSDDDKGAIAAFREAVRLSPEYADAHANLGAALTPTDADAAVAELERAVALAPGSVNAHYNLAMAYGASPGHGLEREIEQLRKVLGMAPTFARAHLALGKALLQSGQVPDAIASLQEAARLDPTSGEAHYQLGLALARGGRKDDAASELQKGRDLVSADDRRQNAALDLDEGRAALDRGDFAGAEAKFRHAAALQPDSADAAIMIGMVLEKQGKPGEAADAYRQALEINPGAGPAKDGFARVAPSSAAAARPPAAADPPAPQPTATRPPTTSAPAQAAGGDAPDAAIEEQIRQGQYAAAEAGAAEYVRQHPKSSWGWYVLGYSCFAQQKIGESIKALAQSLQLDITNAEAHKILGRDLMLIGRFDAAQVEFEQGLRYKPDSAELHYNLGKLFSIQDNWEPARKEFEAAVRLDPSYLEAIDALGFAQEALGDDQSAVANYRKAIALNTERKGTFAASHVNMSAYYNRTGDAKQALEYAQQALELDPKSDRAWFQKARAQERDGQLEAAVSSLNNAISLNPRASSYYYVLSGIYRRMGWTDESKKALDEFKRLDQESAELDKQRRGATRSSDTRTAPSTPRD